MNDFESTTTSNTTNTASGSTTSTFYTYKCKPPCFKSKCDCCEWRCQCANRDHCVPHFPWYPQVTWCWDGRTTSGSGTYIIHQ